MTERVMSRIEKWSNRIMTFCAVGTCLCIAGLAYMQVRTGTLASEGKKARIRQQAVYPVSLLVYEDARRRGVISADDLTCFKTGERCPATPATTP